MEYFFVRYTVEKKYVNYIVVTVTNFNNKNFFFFENLMFCICEIQKNLYACILLLLWAYLYLHIV